MAILPRHLCVLVFCFMTLLFSLTVTSNLLRKNGLFARQEEIFFAFTAIFAKRWVRPDQKNCFVFICIIATSNLLGKSHLLAIFVSWPWSKHKWAEPNHVIIELHLGNLSVFCLIFVKMLNLTKCYSSEWLTWHYYFKQYKHKIRQLFT